MPTADGRGKDLASSAQRLSRMLGLDLESEHDLAEIGGVASYIAAQQRHRIENALDLVLSRGPRQRTQHHAGRGRSRGPLSLR